MSNVNRPTPETDALEASLVNANRTQRYYRALNLARKLERERGAAISRFESSQEARVILKRELDEAREELLKLRIENNHNWQAIDFAEEAMRDLAAAQEVIRGYVAH